MTARLSYRPYGHARDVPNVVVDGSPNANTVLTLSHWPGLSAPDHLRDDLSAQMVFRYLDEGARRHAGAQTVTNDHFDQDGLVGLFALVDPDTASRHRALLVDIAGAGDFATYRFRTAARLSMALAAFTDGERSPLGSDALAGRYDDRCAALYTESLGRLPQMLERPDSYRSLWEEEDRVLTESEAALASNLATVEEIDDVDVAIVRIPDEYPSRDVHRFTWPATLPLHPMAVHNATGCFRIVTLWRRRYELAYRYESWVQYRSRRPLPRVDLAPLAERLGSLEQSARWEAEPVGELTPRLHLAGDDESAIEPSVFVRHVVEHLRTAPPAWNPYVEATSR